MCADNFVILSVYKENVAKMYVSSMSFNPVSWECSACPRKHPVLGGGGDASGGGGGQDSDPANGSELPGGPTLGERELPSHC